MLTSSDDDEEDEDESGGLAAVAFDADGKPMLIVEHAKSDRSKCQICKTEIARKAVRIGGEKCFFFC